MSEFGHVTADDVDQVARQLEKNVVLHKEDEKSKQKPRTRSKSGSLDYKKLLQHNISASKKYGIFSKKSKKFGIPKKGGAGGAFTWGKLGSEVGTLGYGVDRNDPNYESDVENPPDFILYPKKKIQDIETDLLPDIEEYLVNGDVSEFIMTLKSEWKMTKENQIDFIKFIVILAMGRTDLSRELVSSLLPDLTVEFTDTAALGEAFIGMLSELDDIILDVPFAVKYLAKFISRAWADQCLPGDFFERCSQLKNDRALDCIEQCKLYLEQEKYLSRIWIPIAGRFRAVNKLVSEIRDIVRRFFEHRVISMTVESIKLLEVPHFLHELVYLLLEGAIEHNKSYTADLVVHLIKELVEEDVLLITELEQGIRSFCKNASDIFSNLPFEPGTPGQSILFDIFTRLRSEKLIDDALYNSYVVETNRRRYKSFSANS